mgnify:CR=1 FL=1
MGRRPGLFFVAAAVLVVACADRVPDQDLRILSAAPTARMSADILWKEYQADLVRADRAYQGKAIVVSGTATKIGTDAPGERYVLFGQSADRGVRANLLDESAADILSNVPDNRRFTLKCYGDGLHGDVLLKSCVRP